MAFNITSDSTQMVPVTASPTSASGAPASVDGALVVSVVSGDGTYTQDPAKPLEVVFVSGVEGETTYRVEVDADLGGGVVLIGDSVIYTVTAPPIPQATAVGLTAGPAVAKA